MTTQYEISVWQDTFTAGSATPIEEKICVIGADDMVSPAAACTPVFKIKANGEKTLNFTLYKKYINPTTGLEEDNPFIPYLVNERKIKLYWDNEWYDLVVKSYSHTSNNLAYSYTCTDAWINELSKSGYNISFTAEQQNNIQSIQDFAEDIIEGTTWQYGVGDTIKQKLEEGVYEVTALSSFSITNQETSQSATVTTGHKFLVFYSIISNKETNFQLWYDPSQIYRTDAPELCVLTGFCGITAATWSNANVTIGGQVYNTAAWSISTNYRAKRLVQSQVSKYDPITDRYVTVWNRTVGAVTEEVYGYNDTQYLKAGVVANLLTNTSNFSTATGWHPTNESGFVNWGLPKYYPLLTTESYSTWNPSFFLDVSSTTANSFMNYGFRDCMNYLPEGLQQSVDYILRFKVALPQADTSTASVTYYNQSTSPITYGGAYYYNRSTYARHENPTNYLTTVGNPTYDATNHWITYTLSAPVGLTVQQIMYESTLNSAYSLGIYFNTTANSQAWLENVELFEKHLDTEGNIIYPNNFSTSPAAVRRSCWYLANQNVSSADELTYIYKGDYTTIPPANVTPIYNSNFEKLRTMTASKSNRFNLLQQCAETFEAWLKITVEHNSNGSIKYVNGIPQKFISFVNELGADTNIVFTYGIDLKQINRTVSSDKIATKTIVAQNSNEYAPNGMCTIQASKLNPSLASYIYDFGYYYTQGLLDPTVVIPALTTLNATLRSYNETLDTLQLKLTSLYREQDNLSASETTMSGLVTATQAEIDRLAGIIASYGDFSEFGVEGKTSLVNFKAYTDAKAAKVIEEHNLTLYSANLSQILTRKTNLLTQISNTETAIATAQAAIQTAENNFESKYANYITEGTWSSEDYTDPNLYYIDAQSVAYTSSRPEVKYTIDIMRLDSLPEFSSKHFNLGDICYVEDIEYFGYADVARRTPYHERIVVTELSFDLTNPIQNTVTVQNYRDKFDSLFSKITASVQSLQYKSGSYDKAASIVTDQSTIEEGVLNKSLEENTTWILSSSDNSVTQDQSGITLESKINAQLRTKITANGILISKDGGESYESAISANGINTALLTSGNINTEKLNIVTGDIVNFRWDKTGINAYEIGKDLQSLPKPNYKKFTRMDQFGFYGIDATTDTGTNYTFYNFEPSSTSEITNNNYAKFGLLWDKFFFKSRTTGGLDLSFDDQQLQINKISDNVLHNILSVDNEGNFTLGNFAETTGNELILKNGIVTNEKLESTISQNLTNYSNAFQFNSNTGLTIQSLATMEGIPTAIQIGNGEIQFITNYGTQEAATGMRITATRAIAPVGFIANQYFAVSGGNQYWQMTTTTDGKFQITLSENQNE